MPQRMPKLSSASLRSQTRPNRKLYVTAPADPAPASGLMRPDALVEPLEALRVDAMLGALKESIRSQNEGKHMAEPEPQPERILTADEAMTKVQALDDIKARLKRREARALREAKAIRNQVVAKELQKFDDKIEMWLKT